MEEKRYLLKHTDEIITPCLIYYKDIIEQNIKEMISVAGNANRLWPHVKSHKMKKLVELQIKMGITRFKCATIAEAQMVAESGASDALVAYPLVGPNIDRFLELVKTYAGTRFWAIGDDLEQVSLLNSAAGSQETIVNFLADVNMGTNRTGISINTLPDFYRNCCKRCQRKGCRQNRPGSFLNSGCTGADRSPMPGSGHGRNPLFSLPCPV